MRNKHVFWILIDSARNHPSDYDDRGLPKSVVEFSKTAQCYKNVVTTATSTVMSVSSMMTSKPAYLLSTSYDNIPDISKYNKTLPSILNQHGYNVHGSIYFKHGREVLSSLFDLPDKRFMPKGLSHSKEWWNNEEVYGLFRNTLANSDLSAPNFYYLHYNVRVDDNISEIFDKTLQKIKDANIWDESLIIVNSDHGYPNKTRNFNPELEKKNNWGHDRLLTNDNILTPLVIRYPNCKPMISEGYRSTLDISHTILDYLGITHELNSGFGQSLLTNSYQAEYFRTDNRYASQAPSSTSVVIDKHKIIELVDGNDKISYEIYDLVKDKDELKPNDKVSPLLKSKLINQLEEIKDEYNSILIQRLKVQFAWIEKLKGENVVFVSNASKRFSELYKEVFGYILNCEVSVIGLEDLSSISENQTLITIFLAEIPWKNTNLYRNVKVLKSKKVYTDNNGFQFRNMIFLNMYIRYVARRSKILLKYPRVILELLDRLINRTILAPIK